jgi:hypothetical protein
MATEFTVFLEERIGALASLAETLAQSGINIIAIHATECPGRGIVQLMTNNDDATVNALSMAGLEFTTRRVLLLSLADEPGQLARLARAIAQADININAIYITMSGQIVLDADDLSGAQRVALDLGIF